MDATEELLRIARMNCRHEFDSELNTIKGDVMEYTASYKCRKCHGVISFQPYDKELSYD